MFCTVDDCDRHTRAAGYCSPHYARSRKYPGNAEKLHAPIGVYGRKGCLVDGCAEPHKALGYCNGHHVRFSRTGSPAKTGRKPRAKAELKTCSEDGCAKPCKSAGFCSMHYTRLRRHGSTDTPVARNPNLFVRFASRVEADGDCWRWTGQHSKDGYGYFTVSKRVEVRAHRWAWENVAGLEIPEKYVLDHICQTRDCVRPGHLQALTVEEHSALTSYRSRMTKLHPGWEYVADARHQSMAELLFGLENRLPTAISRFC
jgi:hypothetical protein